MHIVVLNLLVTLCSAGCGWWLLLIYCERKLLLAGAYAVWCERKILLASAGAASRTEEVFQEIVVSMNYMKILKRLPHKGRTNYYYLSTYLHYHIIQ